MRRGVHSLMLIDLHSHSTLSDGDHSPDEMVAAAERNGYDVYALTDHASPHDYRDMAAAVRAEIDRVRPHTSVQLFAGVELTELDPDQIARAAQEVRRHGAEVVVVNGEYL